VCEHKETTEINISIFRNGKYYHVLKFKTDGDDSYVCFMSNFREKIRTSDGTSVFYKKAPDHISYHKDGKVHITHKDGSHHDLPFKMTEKFLADTALYNLPWVAISFYDESFEEHTPFFKVLDKKPDNHTVVESHNVTLTVLVKLRDLTDIPLENRAIEFEVRIGGMIPDKPYPNLIEDETNIGKKFPILSVCLNPTNEMTEEFRLFSESEVANVGKLHEYLKKTFSPTHK